jgi:hypothetical protein
MDVTKNFLEKGSNYDFETKDPFQKEINSQYQELAKSVSSLILSSEWFEENVSMGSSLLVINYLTKIDLYERALKISQEELDNRMVNFYYDKIKDLTNALNELL